ncbi:sensor histidine kinase [Phaeacidiphilus oryzae]|uniref:sensor histidine kinase n=1 Tax=Phaeacidiphilus oryzae TaxID=348818 RepID=UPI00069187D4|nr:histidine kinase [Phaeacidiphilus oryzae]
MTSAQRTAWALTHPRARAWLRRYRRLRRADLRHPWRLDLLLVVLVVILGVSGLGYPHRAPFGPSTGTVPTTVAFATIAGQGIALFWRRRAPLAVFYVVLALCTAQWLGGAFYRSDVALMVALYGVARHSRVGQLPWVAGATLVALVVPAVRANPLVSTPDSLFFLISAATAAAALGLAARIREAQLAVLAERAARLEIEREQRVQLATIAERERVSREMHDIIGHNLAVIIGLADGGASIAAADPGSGAEAMRIISETGRHALAELRATLGALRDRPENGRLDAAELSPQPGIAELHGLLERLRAAGPEVVYTTSGDPERVAPSVQLAVYRIAQEALTNALKHSGSGTRVRVALRITDREVRLGIWDSGPVGAEAAAPSRWRPGRAAEAAEAGEAERRGLGLVGIQERAGLIGGRAGAGPRPGGGWKVWAVLPPHPDPFTEESGDPEEDGEDRERAPDHEEGHR